jgi:hypothetical protein
MPQLRGGPLDGQNFFSQEMGDIPPEQGGGAPMGMPGGEGGGLPPELQALLAGEQSSSQGPVDWDSMDEVGKFNSFMAGIRSWMERDLDSEQSRLRAEKARTLLQEVKAADEKETEQAMTGKASPRMMRRAYSGGGGSNVGGGAPSGGY